MKEMRRIPIYGTGKPEKLKHNLAGLWSRRIDQEHRIVYCFTAIKDGIVFALTKINQSQHKQYCVLVIPPKRARHLTRH